MSVSLDVLEVFLNNPSKSFNVSDVMRCFSVCWVTARDSIVNLRDKGWLVHNGFRWRLNKDKIKIIKFSS